MFQLIYIYNTQTFKTKLYNSSRFGNFSNIKVKIQKNRKIIKKYCRIFDLAASFNNELTTKRQVFPRCF